MPLRNDLLNPISPDKPSGEDLHYNPVYDKIKEARREDDDVPQGDWKRERKVADWVLVVKLTSESLATKSKDLQLAAWLTEAMTRREGISGLRASLGLLQGLVETFWDTLYPELEDGEAEYRAAPLQWVGDKMEIPLKQCPIVQRGGHDWFRYKESRTVGTEEQANESYEKQQARAQAIKEGKLTAEEFDKSFDESPKAYYVALLENFDGTMQALSDLGSLCDEKFGGFSPNFGTLSRALEEVRQTVYILLQKKREKEPDAVVEQPQEEAEPEPQAYVEEPVAVAAGAAAAPAKAPARKGSLAAEPQDREDAVARVIVCAKYLRTQEPLNPASYMMLRGLRWGELRAGGDVIDQRLLTPPPSEIRQSLKTSALDNNWEAVLDAAETAQGMECGRGWIDLQRYAARACQMLGYSYHPVRAAIVSGLKALLTDYPQLLEYTLMDDTPAANSETLAWIKEEILPPPPPEPVAAAPAEEPAWTPPPMMIPEQPVNGEPAPPDAYELAVQAAKRGRPQEAIEILMREMAGEPTGRGRFQRRSQLAELCISTGYQTIAFPILKELAGEIERRSLEQWEAAEMVAQVLAMLYKCMAKDGPAEEAQKLYAWICRLDPLLALNVAK
jgi:type VI secretion system protein ImpA